jgi:hypothetical protein
MVYTAALGGAYVPVFPFELTHDEFMLSMVSRQDLMSTVPNVISISREKDPLSLGYGICDGIRSGDTIAEQVTGQYSAKLPEVLFADIDRIRATSIHKYFRTFSASNDCDVFLGALRNAREPEGKGSHPLPRPEAKFSAEEFGAYVAAVHMMELDIEKIIGSSSASRP